MLNNYEKEIILKLVKCNNINQLAKEIKTSKKVLKNKLQLLYAKFNVKNKIQLIIYCIKEGFL